MSIFRRRFLQKLTTVSMAGVAVAEGAPIASRNVTWTVKGFTCVTCAVGLETLLRREAGVLQVRASYPQGKVHIDFDPQRVTEKVLRERISDMGFSVERAG
jgi:copper chaperone CopZ